MQPSAVPVSQSTPTPTTAPSDGESPQMDMFGRSTRPVRNRVQRLFYDAAKGGYVPGNPGNDIDN